MNIRLILFDFDFTLVDASGCLFGALQEGLRAIGVDAPPDQVLKPLIGIPLEEQYRTLVNADPNDKARFSVFSRAYVSARNEGEANGSSLLPGVIEALAELTAKGFILGILSTGAPGRIHRTLTRLGTISFFGDHIFGGASDKAAVIANAARQLKVRLAHTMYVGDRPDDGLAAQRAGVEFIGVTTGAFEASAFPPQFRVILSLSELSALLPD